MSREFRRQQLDRQLMPFGPLVAAPTPAGGWVRAIREALGMSLQTFSTRMGLTSRSTALQIEQAEVEGSITVKRLRAAADALGCDVAIVFVPRIPLTQMTEERAREKAEERVKRVGHSMVMESQGVYGSRLDEIVERTTREILSRGDSRLWD
ncbi:mobile mystery protein A [Fimbriimonas ginsengisoli]|nr:mobile mystery protein A [Fimbriimonas ginsengisoli]